MDDVVIHETVQNGKVSNVKVVVALLVFVVSVIINCLIKLLVVVSLLKVYEEDLVLSLVKRNIKVGKLLNYKKIFKL